MVRATHERPETLPILSVFQRHDAGRTGKIPTKTMIRVLRLIDSSLADSTADKLVMLADVDGTGMVDYMKFIEDIFGKAAVGEQEPAPPQSTSKGKAAQLKAAKRDQQLKRVKQDVATLKAKYDMLMGLFEQERGLSVDKVGVLAYVIQPDRSLGSAPHSQVSRALIKPAKSDENHIGSVLSGRSLVMPLNQEEELTAMAAEAARSVCAEIISMMGKVNGQRDLFFTSRECMHVTVVSILSHTDDPALDELELELAALRRLARKWGPVELEAYNVVCMTSGVVLLLFLPVLESEGNVGAFQQDWEEICETCFPNAHRAQPHAYYCSLARICFAPADPSSEELADVRAACDRATKALRGRRVKLENLWYVTDCNETTWTPPARARPARSSLGSWPKAAPQVSQGDIVNIPIGIDYEAILLLRANHAASAIQREFKRQSPKWPHKRGP